MESKGGGAKREWVVICVGCLRVKRGAHWTDERAGDVNGQSTGYCDRCAKARRKALKLR